MEMVGRDRHHAAATSGLSGAAWIQDGGGVVATNSNTPAGHRVRHAASPGHKPQSTGGFAAPTGTTYREQPAPQVRQRVQRSGLMRICLVIMPSPFEPQFPLLHTRVVSSPCDHNALRRPEG
jgi:hypothetical protein